MVLVKIIDKPVLDELPAVLRRALQERNMIIVIGECTVEYEGRGSSKLEPGERVLIIKQDGSVLLHRPRDYSPVNWQPDTSLIEVWVSNGGLSVLAVRDKPREILSIWFSRVDLVVLARLEDHGEFSMYLDESEVKRVLMMHPELIEPGLRILEDEKRLGSGQADLYGVDKDGNPVIIELKRVTATRDAVLQLYSYVKFFEASHGRQPRGILVAPAFSPSAIEALSRLRLEYRLIDLRELMRIALEKGVRRSLMDYFKKTRGND